LTKIWSDLQVSKELSSHSAQLTHYLLSMARKNRPSVCIHNITHHAAAGSGRKTAHNHTTTPPTPPFSFRSIAIRTAESIHKPVNLTHQPAIWPDDAYRNSPILIQLHFLSHCLPTLSILEDLI
jgi:hypothetical protein